MKFLKNMNYYLDITWLNIQIGYYEIMTWVCENPMILFPFWLGALSSCVGYLFYLYFYN